MPTALLQIGVRHSIAGGHAEISPEAPPWFHAVPGTSLVLGVDGSKLFQVSPQFYDRLVAADPEALDGFREMLQTGAIPQNAACPDAASPPTALALNVAQVCNLACSYCYADEGRFGGAPRLMAAEIAMTAIDRLIDEAGGRPVTIGFIGGEPFLNRAVLKRSVEHAQMRAAQERVRVGFSITTNGTLLTADDVRLLREAGFAVTVSLDGKREVNDRYRRSRDGSSSLDRACAAVRPLLLDPGKARVAARATVTRDDLDVAGRVDALSALGFTEVGISPLRSGPAELLALGEDDWAGFLAEMVRAADSEFERVRAGAAFRFSNLAIALKEIHRGSCRPLPCGAAAGYVAIDASGDYFTCHRTTGDTRFLLGHLESGPTSLARQAFLTQRHVDRQEPCRTCWARYLCGGGCHAEVLSAGRSGCDFVRGWLEYCLRLYDRALMERPDLFA